jgi:two-component system, LytTR family, response regulator
MLNTFLIENKKKDEIEPGKNNELQRVWPDPLENKALGIVKTIHIPDKKKRTRLVVRRGIENISILIEDIVLFYTQNKITYVIDKTCKKYIVEKNLSELDKEFDDSVFFRANRQYIISINYLKGFRMYERVKVKIDIRPEELNNQYYIIVSQEKAPVFKKWIYSA